MNSNPNTDVTQVRPEPSVVEKLSKQTLVVNFFAGPGAGKSTTAAGVFCDLQTRGVNCEIAAEFAKDLVWEERFTTFKDQIYLFGKQYHRIFRLLGQVDVVLTDSPILLSPIYDAEKRASLEQLVIEEHRKMWTYNVFLTRKKPFNAKGRNQNLEESKQLDCLIADLLYKHGVPFETFDGTPEGREAIVKKILILLAWKDGQGYGDAK
jgi:hypothetical protein